MEEQKILQEILQTVKATADRVDAQERRIEAIQEDIVSTENDVVLYKITTNQHSDILGNLEQRVATLESRISA